MIRINVTEILIGRRCKVDLGFQKTSDISLVKLSHRSPLKSLIRSFVAAEEQNVLSSVPYAPSKNFRFTSGREICDDVSMTVASVDVDANSTRF